MMLFNTTAKQTAPALPAAVTNFCHQQQYPLSSKKSQVLSYILTMYTDTDMDTIVADLGNSGVVISRSSIYQVLQWLTGRQVIIKTTKKHQVVYYRLNMEKAAQWMA